MSMPLEVIYQHAAHYLTFVQGSGFQGERVLIDSLQRFQLNDLQGPNDLKIIKKPNMLILQRNLAGLSQQLVSYQQATAYTEQHSNQDQALLRSDYDLSFRISDRTHGYLAQQINLQIGIQADYQSVLYRSVKGSRLTASGGIQGKLLYSDGVIASWSIITVTVAPLNALPALVFKAQADFNGEFILPLDRLVMPSVASQDQPYQCTLSVDGDYQLSASLATASTNTTQFNAVSLALDGDDLNQQSNDYQFDFVWGERQLVNSLNAACLYIHKPN